jgi:Flp pilus assembly protein CpaB
MWKVKRMNTARIVVLTIAVGAGGIAAFLASGSDNKPPPAEPVAQLQTVDVLVAKSDIGLGQTVTLELKPEQTETLARSRQSGTLSLALRSIADLNVVDRSDDQAPRRGDSVNVVRFGVSTPTTTQK